MEVKLVAFIIACVVVALEYMHSMGAIHRDVKPENMVLDRQGYVRLADFGTARMLSQSDSADFSGTPGYMAPEVMFQQGHGVAVDYFALGVVAYELMKRVVWRRYDSGRDRIGAARKRSRMRFCTSRWSSGERTFRPDGAPQQQTSLTRHPHKKRYTRCSA